ncbi:hypothetical protein DDZ18_13020 [Marinicauda salina]|uniref:DUF4908 domain-containing protein n=1 Tax=Marinicauda salina TaxID=2135793 RepID=A0A2U2BQQ3_9PROT|nr:DUF4908 domain-containing protein [Marinicauda salina]PWE16340.1 hypothetical protein DDZ18_13020 [Marinicauda salina]
MFRALVALLWIAAALAGPAHAQSGERSNPLSRLVERDAERQPAAAWYERADGRGRFLFDRSSRPALVRPEGSEEVYAVRAARAAGGGEVWVTDTDRVLLRTTNLGGVTYFPPNAPDGVLVDRVGPAEPVEAEPVSSADLEAAAEAMADSLAALTRGSVTAELTAPGPEENALILDAMAMIERAVDAAPRRAVRSLRVVRIGVGERPRASYEDGVLDISVSPAMGYGGRPSSDYIRRTLEVAD